MTRSFIKREYSESFLQVLSALKAKELLLSIATSRNKYFVNNVIRDLEITSPVIIENGSLIYDLASKSPLEVSYLDQDLVTDILIWCLRSRSNFKIGFSTTESFYVNQMYHKSLSKYFSDDYLSDLKQLKHKDYLNITSIWIRDLENDDFEYLRNLNLSKNTIIRVEEKQNLKPAIFFMNANSYKEYGFTKWCGYCNISTSEVVFIGDSDSDIRISELSGLGCAVGNASEDLKSTSQIVAAKNYGDGTAEILKRIFKI